MRILSILMLSAALISLTACSSVSGNVVPKSKPSMEKVYDSMSKTDNSNGLDNIEQVQTRRSAPTMIRPTVGANLCVRPDSNVVSHEFHKISNPELQMYIYPHLAGRDQIPVPGYFTVFNVYTQQHYEI